MVRIAPGTKPWDALMEIVLDGIEGKADNALAQLENKLEAASNLGDLVSKSEARTILSVYSKAEADGLFSAGNGIASINKTGTVGLVDTYQIMYDDGTSKDFDVTNGEDGTGIASIALHSTAGTNPVVKTYRITFDDATTFDFAVANGVKGDLGDAGPAATMRSTSGTSQLIATGSKTFTLAEMAVPFQVGMVLRVVSQADANNYMAGIVTAATATSVTLTISEIGGSGTKNDWTVVLGAFRGATGPQGSANIFGPAGSVPGPYPDGTVTYEY